MYKNLHWNFELFTSYGMVSFIIYLGHENWNNSQRLNFPICENQSNDRYSLVAGDSVHIELEINNKCCHEIRTLLRNFSIGFFFVRTMANLYFDVITSQLKTVFLIFFRKMWENYDISFPTISWYKVRNFDSKHVAIITLLLFSRVVKLGFLEFFNFLWSSCKINCTITQLVNS